MGQAVETAFPDKAFLREQDRRTEDGSFLRRELLAEPASVGNMGLHPVQSEFLQRLVIKVVQRSPLPSVDHRPKQVDACGLHVRIADQMVIDRFGERERAFHHVAVRLHRHEYPVDGR